jgi:hypothetical protein
MYSDIRPPARMHDREARLEALDRMAQQVARQQERGHFKAVTRTRTCTSCLNDTLHQLGLPDGSIEGLRRMDWDEGYEPATRFAVFAHFTHGIDVVNVPSIVGLDEDEDLPSALADARAEGAPSDERRGAASDPGGGDSALEAAHRRWIYLWAQRNAERFGQDPVKLGPAAFNFSYERRWRDPVLGDITAPGGPGAQTLRARILRDGLRLQAAAPTPDAAAILGTTPFTHDYDVLAAVGRVPPERLQAAGLGDLWDLHEAYDKRETVVRGLIEAWLLGQLQSGINVTATLTQAGMAAQVESCLRDTLHTSRASS